jgi:hypothetical protein
LAQADRDRPERHQPTRIPADPARAAFDKLLSQDLSATETQENIQRPARAAFDKLLSQDLSATVTEEKI